MIRFRLRELIGRWEVENGSSLSLDELANATGVSRQVLAKMGDPKGYVTSTRHVEEICHFFLVSPNDLIVFDCKLGTAKENRPNVAGGIPDETG